MLLPEDLSDICALYWPQSLPPEGMRETTMDDISIVTAFFDIGRSQWGIGNAKTSQFQRSTDQYLGYFAKLAQIKNQLIVFTEESLSAKVLDLRRQLGLENNTIIFTIKDLFSHPGIAKLEQAIANCMTEDFRRIVWHPDAPEYNKPKYIIVNALKSSFACTAIAQKVVSAPQLAWIDFGYCREDNRFEKEKPWKFDTQGKINLFHISQPEAASVLFAMRTGTVFFQGCHIVAPNLSWPAFNRELSSALTKLIDCSLIDDDQTLLLMAWMKSPNNYRIHPIDPVDWFVLFRRKFDGSEGAIAQAPTPLLSWKTELSAIWKYRLNKRLRQYAKSILSALYLR